MNARVRERLIAILVDQNGIDENKLTDDAHFVNDLGFDSLDGVELVMELEEEFDISIPDEKAELARTIGKAVALLAEAITPTTD
jgi:acyl carrier protein